MQSLGTSYKTWWSRDLTNLDVAKANISFSFLLLFKSTSICESETSNELVYAYYSDSIDRTVVRCVVHRVRSGVETIEEWETNHEKSRNDVLRTNSIAIEGKRCSRISRHAIFEAWSTSLSFLLPLSLSLLTHTHSKRARAHRNTI